MHTANVETESLLTPAEVASLFRVDPKTVTRWARSGKLSAVRTLGGHRRYRESEVMHLLSGVPVQREEPVSTA
ncbi:MAG: BldC family transcriptional regulator [Micrococcales bacterium]|nr:BldC family transcriptional regulator [Micrococcales bacterium]